MKKFIVCMLLISSLFMTASSMENPSKEQRILNQSSRSGVSAPSIPSPFSEFESSNHYLEQLELTLNNENNDQKKQEIIKLCPPEAIAIETSDAQKKIFFVSKEMQQKFQLFQDMQEFEEEDITSLPLTYAQLVLLRKTYNSDFSQIIQASYNSVEKIFDLYRLRKALNFLNNVELLPIIDKQLNRLTLNNDNDIQLKQSLNIVTRDARSISTIALSPDGALLASASDDDTIKVCNPKTGECLNRLRGHTDRITSIAFSPNGALLASGSYDNTLNLWNPKTGYWLRNFTRHTDWITSVAFSPDNILLASGSHDKTIKLWNSKTRHYLHTLSGHTDEVQSIAFSLNGALLASGSDDKTIKVWDLQTKQCLHTLIGHADWVLSVVFSPDCVLLASRSHDNSIKLWDSKTGKCLLTHSVHNSCLRSVAFSPDGKQLAVNVDDTITFYTLCALAEIEPVLFNLIDYVDQELLAVKPESPECIIDPKLHTILHTFCNPKFQEFIKRYIDIKESEEKNRIDA